MARFRTPSLNGVENNNMQNQSLLNALQGFPLEESFLPRLCRENKWSAAQGRRAIGEYKRFVYLASVSPVPVTPPPAVDRVWHLHLLYTRSYWNGLCPAVLGRPLHHGPTAGGREEDEKFGNWYDRTLTLYREEFGAAPPADLWPARFGAETRDKPSFSVILPSVFPLLLIGAGAIPPLLIAAFIGFIALIVKLACTGSSKKKRRGEGGDFAGFSCSSGDSDCGDSGGGDCGGGDGGGGCGGGGCGGGGD